MRTRREGKVVYHYLDDHEEWADYGMDQPNRMFGHRLDWPYCPRCNRPLRVKTVVKHG